MSRAEHPSAGGSGGAVAPADPMAAARALAPEIAAAADRIDAERELPPALARRIAEAGLFRLLVPRSLAGAEMALPAYVEVIETLGGADASTAWCVNQGCVFATNAAFVARETAERVWSDPLGVIANGPSPTARAVEVDGGYRVSGHWAFSSGIRHAPWLAGLAFVVDEDGARRLGSDGAPVLRHMLFPKDEARLVEHWDVAGLRGTGSHHFEVENLFVPRARTVYTYADPPLEPGPLYLYPMILLFACGFAAVACGVARAALDALVAAATTRQPRGTAGSLRDHALVQMQVGRAEATLRAARALLRETVGEVWEEVAATRALTLEHRVRLRLATTHAIRSCAEVVDAAYDGFGAEGIYAGSPIQRRFQDMHVITQHIQARLAHVESCGRFFLGLEPDMKWL